MLLFVPLGWALRYWASTPRVALISLGTTVLIELAQATVIPGRDSSLRDVLGNAVGGALGAWLYVNWATLRRPGAGRSLRLGAQGGAAWLAVLSLTGWGGRMAPTDAEWFGGWAPELGLFSHYPGKILSVTVEGVTPEEGPLSNSGPIREAMKADRLSLLVRVVSGAHPTGPAPIFLVTDGIDADQLFVGQDRRALWFHVRSRFEQWGFRGMIARLPLFPGRAVGDTALIDAGVANRTVYLRATSMAGRDEVALPLTVGWAWYGLLPMRYPMWHEWMVLNPLWLAGLALPFSYWLARANPRSAVVLVPVVVVAGLWAIPLLTGAAPSTAGEWLGALAGGVAGWSGGAVSRRRNEFHPTVRSNAPSLS